MNLYINTSGAHCEIALLSNETVAHKVHKEPMEHSTVLHDLINDMLKETELALQDLKSIAVLNGPGSYTGLRIGLAAAKGFCYALNVPLILFNKLELSCKYYKSIQPSANYIACLEPARQGEYFFYLEGANEEICKSLVRSADFILEQLNTYPSTSLISSSTATFEEIPNEVTEINIPINFIGQEVSKKLSNSAFEDIFSSEPFYLKKVHTNQPKKRF